MNGISAVTGDLGTFIGNGNRNDPNYSTRPKAFINYILLDEQFRFVAGNFSPVNNSPNMPPKDHYTIDPQLQQIPVTKNGYLCVCK